MARCGPMRGVRGRLSPNSPEGQAPQRIPRRSCGSARTRATRRGWRRTPASSRCCRPFATIPRGSWARAVRSRFGDTLPFLMKVLAADEPLSLQAHPSAEQAVEGFAREDRLGIPVSSPIRNYRDRSHKPELLVALQTVRGARRFPARAEDRRVDARAGGSDLDPFVGPAGRPARRRRSARAVHHVDHRAAAGSRRAGARGDRRRDPLCPFGGEGIRGRSQDRARTRGALSR